MGCSLCKGPILWCDKDDGNGDENLGFMHMCSYLGTVCTLRNLISSAFHNSALKMRTLAQKV